MGYRRRGAEAGGVAVEPPLDVVEVRAGDRLKGTLVRA
jgi:hypothetical protein